MALIGVLIGTIASVLLTTWWFDGWLVHKHVFNTSPKSYYLTYWIRFLFVFLLGFCIKFLCSFYKFENIIHGVFLNRNIGDFVNLFAMLLTCIIVVNGLFILLFFRKPEFKYIYNLIMEIVFKKNKLKKNKK